MTCFKKANQLHTIELVNMLNQLRALESVICSRISYVQSNYLRAVKWPQKYTKSFPKKISSI